MAGQEKKKQGNCTVAPRDDAFGDVLTTAQAPKLPLAGGRGARAGRAFVLSG